MATCRTVSFFLPLVFLLPVSVSFSTLPEDPDGSGYDLEGSGSGDWSEQVSAGEIKDMKVHLHSDDLTFSSTQSPTNDIGSGFVFVENSKSFLENKQVFAAVIAGGLTGGILAALTAAVLIYKWHKKNDEGYILGQQAHNEECDA